MENLASLIGYVNRQGWFSGTATLEIKMERSFEGFYGRASEDWENQYTIKTNEIKNSEGQLLLPVMTLESLRYESLDELAKRFLSKIIQATLSREPPK